MPQKKPHGITISASREGAEVVLFMQYPKVRHIGVMASRGKNGDEPIDSVKALATLFEICDGTIDGTPATVDDFLDLDFSSFAEVEKALAPFLGVGSK